MRVKKRILVLGSTGMLGHVVYQFLKDTEHEVYGLSRGSINTNFSENKTLSDTNNFDAKNNSIIEYIENLESIDFVINCIGAIKARIDDKNSIQVMDAILINSLFPHRLSSLAIKNNFKVIQIATDCVYSGVKGGYSEKSPFDPLDVYGKSKSLGEIVDNTNFINLRCSIIGKEIDNKSSLMEWVLNQPLDSSISGYRDHNWNGITTLAFAKLVLAIINHNNLMSKNPVTHVIPRDQLNKYDLLKVITKIFDRTDIDVQATNSKISVDRTLITDTPIYNSELWQAAGYSNIPTIEELIQEYRYWY